MKHSPATFRKPLALLGIGLLVLSGCDTMTPEQRTAIYALAPAFAAVLVAFGWVTGEQAATITGAVTAILAVLVAFVHRPTKES